MIVKLYPTDTVVLCSTTGESLALTYEAIEKAFSKKTPRKYKQSSPGAQLSRIVALRVNAFEKGAWATGAVIDRQVMLEGLLEELSNQPVAVYTNLTTKAIALLRRLSTNNMLSKKDRDRVLAFVSEAETALISPSGHSVAAS